MTTITLLGAGGKMGLRITDNLRKTDYDVRYVKSAIAERPHYRSAGLPQWQRRKHSAKAML